MWLTRGGGKVNAGGGQGRAPGIALEQVLLGVVKVLDELTLLELDRGAVRKPHIERV